MKTKIHVHVIILCHVSLTSNEDSRLVSFQEKMQALLYLCINLVSTGLRQKDTNQKAVPSKCDFHLDYGYNLLPVSTALSM